MTSRPRHSQYQVAACVVLTSMVACKNGEAPYSGPRSVDQCGSGLEELMQGEDWLTPPALTASYSEALESWPYDKGYCGLGVFSGECADGKRLLYRNGGFTSEIRYFEGEQLVGVVVSGDVGVCPSVCPFSGFYGSLESVRCNEPVFQDLCAEASSLEPEPSWLHFANGEAPGGCEDLGL